MRAKKTYWAASVEISITKRDRRTIGCDECGIAETPLEYLSEPVANHKDAAGAARILLKNLAIEGVVVVMLDGAGRVTGAARLALGVVDRCVVWTRQVYTAALMCNAASVIFAHNHPGESREPSDADWSMVKKLRQAGDALDIPLLDSIIITEQETVSMRKMARWQVEAKI